MTRRLTEAQVKKVLVEYDLQYKLDTFLTFLGPLCWKRPKGDLPKRPISAYRDYVVLTKLGMLGISAPKEDGDAIFCVFEEADRARQRFDVGVSGKWNHHAFVSYVHKPTSKMEMVDKMWKMFENFKTQMFSITE